MNKYLADAQIAEKYRILEPLGEGGFGAVYKAEQKDLRRTVAIKFLRVEPSTGDRERAQFQREAKVLSTLKHRNIVDVFSFGIASDGAPFIVMEYLEGKTLASVIAETSGLSEGRTQKIALQLCQALKAAHEANIIHRDLKPQNIMLVEDGNIETVKLLDFGLSKMLISDASNQSATNTKTGTLLGSPMYMSPEACKGQKTDERSDIYSWACIVYECLAGEAPFTADSPMGLLYKHCNEAPQPFGRRTSPLAISREFESIIFTCLNKDPQNRYQSAMLLQSDLLALQLGKTISVDVGGFAPAKNDKQTHSARVLTFVVMSILIIAVGLTLIRIDTESKTKREVLKSTIFKSKHSNQIRFKGSPESRLRTVSDTIRQQGKAAREGDIKKQLSDELNSILSNAAKANNRKLLYMAYLVKGRFSQNCLNSTEAFACFNKALNLSNFDSGAPSFNGALPALYTAQLSLSLKDYGQAKSSSETAIELASKEAAFELPDDIAFVGYHKPGTISDAYCTAALAACFVNDRDCETLLTRARQYAKENSRLNIELELAWLNEVERKKGKEKALSEARTLFDSARLDRDDMKLITHGGINGMYYMGPAGHVEIMTKLAAWFEEHSDKQMARKCFEVILEEAKQHNIQLEPEIAAKLRNLIDSNSTKPQLTDQEPLHR